MTVIPMDPRLGNSERTHRTVPSYCISTQPGQDKEVPMYVRDDCDQPEMSASRFGSIP